MNTESRTPCHCEWMAPPGDVPWWILATQRARRLIKRTIWTPLTWALDRLGLGLHSVQILCIDRAADQGRGRVLILFSLEVPEEFSPIQGLRASQSLIWPWSYLDPDAAPDARQELWEEATPEPLPLARFRLVHRYREGTWGGRQLGQFRCSVFVVDCRVDEIPLRGETGEGTPCWARIEDAIALLRRPVLTPILLGASIPIGNFERSLPADQGRQATAGGDHA